MPTAARSTPRKAAAACTKRAGSPSVSPATARRLRWRSRNCSSRRTSSGEGWDAANVAAPTLFCCFTVSAGCRPRCLRASMGEDPHQAGTAEGRRHGHRHPPGRRPAHALLRRAHAPAHPERRPRRCGATHAVRVATARRLGPDPAGNLLGVRSGAGADQAAGRHEFEPSGAAPPEARLLAASRLGRYQRRPARLTAERACRRAALHDPCASATSDRSPGKVARGIRLAPSNPTHDGGRGALDRSRGASGRAGVTGVPRAASASAAGPGALVLVTVQFPEPNETFIVREVGELVRRGFEVTIFSLVGPPRLILDADARALVRLAVHPPRFRRVLVDACRTVLGAPGPALRALRRGLRDALAALRTPRLAVTQLAVLPLALAYARRLPATPCRLHAHFASLPTAVVRVLIHARANRRQLPARIAGADRVVTCTAYNRELLASLARDRADAEKVVLCHHGLELDAYSPGRARSPELIVGGASLHPKKGLDHLVAACARLRAQGVRFRCVLVGEGPEWARLERQIHALGLAGRVELAGRLPHRELVTLLRSAALLAHPSVVDRRGSMDGIPNLILEAFAVETPVVATRLSGIPEVVMAEQTGLLVEPGDVDGLADALARVLRDPALGRKLGAAARALVVERFDLGRNVERLAGLLAGAGA
ncbi:MAG: glycosyltransferase family 4 protein [Deltaproteobacteria bacterium]|nr:MAG: glycosyltransferase family 4 protein [Deltaproteobacteria bacterium]